MPVLLVGQRLGADRAADEDGQDHEGEPAEDRLLSVLSAPATGARSKVVSALGVGSRVHGRESAARRGGSSNAASTPAQVRISAPPQCGQSARKARVRRALIAIAAGLALADAAVVTLALPPLLLELDTTVEGVAAVIGVYTAGAGAGAAAVGGAAQPRHRRRRGAAVRRGLDRLRQLRLARAAARRCARSRRSGASALLAAAFDALDGGGAGRRLWVGAAVAGTAAGPALGGALTELFDWRAIFVAQAPIALAAAPALLASPIASVREALPRPPRDVLAAAALALLSGALTAVVFLLVLLLISGWSVEPLGRRGHRDDAAAGGRGRLVRAAAPRRPRALAGCLLVAGGIAGLAFLPEASVLLDAARRSCSRASAWAWRFPALAGELLPRAHPRPGGRAAVAAPLGHHGGAGRAGADRGRRAGRPGAARARARHRAGAGRGAAADRQDRPRPAPVREPRDRRSARRARAGARARAPPRRRRATATCSAASSASTTSSAAAARCWTGSSSSRTSTAARSARPPAGSTGCSAPTARRGCSRTSRRAPPGNSSPEQLGARDRQARGRPRRRGAGGGRTPRSARPSR